ncbi:MAG: sulfurtransferase [Myxococcales bacterium]|nr:sulfurtransferase [Myxococcales bacterium]
MKLLLLGALLAGCGYVGPARPPAGAPPAGDAVAADGWIVTAEAALADLGAGALLLDVRAPAAYAVGHVAGAVAVDWKVFSDSADAQLGALTPDDAQARAVAEALGVRTSRAVRVVGDPVGGWGEDGRLVWTLRTLGHADVALVDGGHAALVRAGAKVSTAVPTPPPGDFALARTPRWHIGTELLVEWVRTQAVAAGRVRFIDARERREYDGETPYGEARGGHLPGAVHLHYKSLLTEDGYLRPRAEVEALLAERGVGRDAPVVVYCTGGVRSGWFVAVLVELGYADARNYAGSMWAWAAAPAETHPLE